MLVKLSVSELLALELFCAGEATAGELAEKLGVKASFASRLLHSLGEKGLVIVERDGACKRIQLSPASHAQAFKRLFQSRPASGVENWLSSRALDVLIVLAFGEGASMKRLAKECASSRPVIYRVLNELRSAGVVGLERGVYRVSDALVLDFANAFADNIQLILQKEIKGGDYAVSARVRKHVVVRTKLGSAPGFCVPTGVSVLQKAEPGIASPSFSDYYFSLDHKKRELSLEECFIHALLLTTLQQHQDRPVLTLFLKTNLDKKQARHSGGLEVRKLVELAGEYAVSTELSELRQSVEFYSRMRGFE